MLEFCPKCQNLFKPTSTEDGLVMECHMCLYRRPISQPVIYSDDYRQQTTEDYPVHEDLCLDKTYPRSNKIICPNPECPSNKPDFPVERRETIMFHYNSDYAQGYLCCECKAFTKNVDTAS